MSDFLLVIPQGWVQLDWNVACSHPAINADAIDLWVQSSQQPYLAELLVEVGLLQPGQTILDAKLIDDEYFLVKLG